MLNQPQPNPTDTDRLATILRQLKSEQIRFVIARNETDSDREAAEKIGVTDNAVKGWNRDGKKQLVDEAVKLMAADGVVTALEIRRRNLAKAMAIKAAGLESESERIRQDTATELIEWELGKAKSSTEVSGNVGVTVLWTPHRPQS